MLATDGHVSRPEESAIGQCTQAPNAVAMIRPDHFRSNPHSRGDNACPPSQAADATTFAHSAELLALDVPTIELGGAHGPVTLNRHPPMEVTP